MRNSIILIIAAGASAATAAAIPVNTAQDSNNVALLSTEAPNHTPQTAAAADTKSDVYEFDAEYEEKLAQVYKAHAKKLEARKKKRPHKPKNGKWKSAEAKKEFYEFQAKQYGHQSSGSPAPQAPQYHPQLQPNAPLAHCILVNGQPQCTTASNGNPGALKPQSQAKNEGDCYINSQGQSMCMVGKSGSSGPKALGPGEVGDPNDYSGGDPNPPPGWGDKGIRFTKPDGTSFLYGLDMDWSPCKAGSG